MLASTHRTGSSTTPKVQSWEACNLEAKMPHPRNKMKSLMIHAPTGSGMKKHAMMRAMKSSVMPRVNQVLAQMRTKTSRPAEEAQWCLNRNAQRR